MILMTYPQYAQPYTINRETLVAIANHGTKIGKCKIIEKDNKF